MTRPASSQVQWPTHAMMFAIALLPLLVVTWALARFFDENFWVVFAWLLAARLFFAAIEFAASVLIWRLVDKRKMTSALLSHLVYNNMPRRYYRHDAYSNYFERVKNDPSTTRDMKEAARQAELMAMLWEERGIFPGLRFSSAMEAALEQYSPRSATPELGVS